mgnify:CR=1 FL=1
MRKTLLLLALMCCLVSVPLFANVQGSYTRKSITALDSVWVFPQSRRLVHNEWAFDMDRFKMFLEHYIELPRFDYNEIPDSLKRSFSNKANSLYDIDIYNLTHLLETTVVQEIVSVLNDPDIQEARKRNFKDEASFQTFAATKAKSFGYTSDELATLFNSAYIYLPFISSAYVQRSEEGLDTVHINGGVIWWKIEVDEQGRTSAREVLTATTWAMSVIDYDRVVHQFSFGEVSWYVNPLEYAVSDAMVAFARNLSVKTRSLDDFKLQAQIVETSGRRLGFPIGRNEGVHLDDGFYIIGYREDSAGNAVPYEKGYARVTKTGWNDFDPTEITYARQIMGSRASLGDVMMENPRLGIDLGLTAGLLVGTRIDPIHTRYSGTDGIDATSTNQITLNARFAYNLAPIVNVSQLFVTIDVGVGFPLADSSVDASLNVLSPYLGVTKAFGGRIYAAATVGAGIDIVTIDYDEPLYEVSISHRAFGLKAEVEVGYLINPNLKVSLYGGYKLGFSPYSSKTELNGSHVAPPNSDDLQLGGVSAGIGVTYSLGSLPINIFGFLDPLKQY